MMMSPEALAQLFHETYERLAPEYGYSTRKASAKPWPEVPEHNRALMVATCTEVLEALTPKVLATDTLGLFQLHGAVIAAQQLMKMILPSYPAEPASPLTPVGEAVTQWRQRYDPLLLQYPRDLVPKPAEPSGEPVDIEVEPDVDPPGTPTEGALWIKEQG